MKTFGEYLTESVASTPHKDLRAEGWKKTGESGEHHVYTHRDHTGHEIHVHPKTGAFEHRVNFSAAHKQKGKDAKGMSELAKHLDAHSRHASYDSDRRQSGDGSGWDRGRSGYSDSPNPRGPQG